MEGDVPESLLLGEIEHVSAICSSSSGDSRKLEGRYGTSSTKGVDFASTSGVRSAVVIALAARVFNRSGRLQCSKEFSLTPIE